MTDDDISIFEQQSRLLIWILVNECFLVNWGRLSQKSEKITPSEIDNSNRNNFLPNFGIVSAALCIINIT